MALPIQAAHGPSDTDAAQFHGADRRETEAFLFAMLLVAALGLEGTLVVFVRRLSVERYPSVIPTPEPVATVLGINSRGLTWFIVALGLMVTCHAAAYAVALRIANPRYGLAAFAVAVVLIATAVPLFPGGAHDVYHNIVDARTLWLYHQNPITTTPNAHPDDFFVNQLFDWRDLTSSYGPVWYLVSGLPLLFTGDGLVANVIGQKLLVSGFLGALALIYLIMRDLRPRQATAAVVLAGWSPLVLWEVAGNGHNDIVMMFFALAAVLAVVKGRWQLAFPLLALAVAVKFIVLLLGPLLLVWLLRRRPAVDRRELVLSIAGAAALLALIYLPFVLASHSLANTDALRNRYISSPASFAIAFAMQYTSVTQSSDYVRALALTLFAAGYLWLLNRCRGDLTGLIWATCWAVFLTLTLPTWWFWPWYVVWLVPFAALAAGRRVATVALVFASSALLVYPIYYWRDVLLNGPDWYANQFVIVGAAFGPVLVYVLATSGLRVLTTESTEPYDAETRLPAV